MVWLEHNLAGFALPLTSNHILTFCSADPTPGPPPPNPHALHPTNKDPPRIPCLSPTSPPRVSLTRRCQGRSARGQGLHGPRPGNRCSVFESVGSCEKLQVETLVVCKGIYYQTDAASDSDRRQSDHYRMSDCYELSFFVLLWFHSYLFVSLLF